MVKDFRIILNQPPQQVFFPGSEVSGALLFVLHEAKSYNCIEIALHGDAHVHWTETQGTGDDSREESYTAREKYVKLEALLWSKQQVPDGKLQPGEYNYPFQFILPAHLPPSFKGSVGSIKYYVEGKIRTGVFKFDRKTQVEIPVVEIVDINFPQLQVPLRQQVEKKVLFSGQVAMIVDLLRTGYCVGDSIPLTVTVDNGTGREVKVRVEVHQTVIYHAQGRRNYGGRGRVANAVSEPMKPKNTSTCHPSITIPPIEPTMTSCGIITIAYSLVVTTVIPRAINLVTKLPITIGNVPVPREPNETTGYPAPVAGLYSPPGWTTDMPPSYESAVGAATNYS